MNYRQRRPGVDSVHDFGHCATVRHIARLHIDPRTLLGQLGDQLTRALGRHPASGHQHQAAHAMSTHQVTGHQATQQARTAGDQHSPIRAPRLRNGVFCSRDAREPRHPHLSAPKRYLRFPRLQHAGQQTGVQPVTVNIDQHEPTGVFGLRRAHQAPHGSRSHVWNLIRSGRDGTASHHREARSSELLLV